MVPATRRGASAPINCYDLRDIGVEQSSEKATPRRRGGLPAVQHHKIPDAGQDVSQMADTSYMPRVRGAIADEHHLDQ